MQFACMKIVKEYLEIFTKAILKNVSAGLSLPEQQFKPHTVFKKGTSSFKYWDTT